MRNILVIGSNGFIGKRVVDALRQKNYKVTTASNETVEYYSDNKLDLNDIESIKDLLNKSKPDIIINCAGIVENSEKAELNYIFTSNLLKSIKESGANVSKVIIMGSAGEYGEVPSNAPVDEGTPLRATSMYAMSKVKETNFALDFCKKNNINLVVARVFNPIGNAMHPRFLIPKLISQIMTPVDGSSILIEINRLDAERDYIDVRDVASAIVSIAENNNSYNVYNIGSGVSTTNQELLNLIMKHRNSDSEVSIVETSTVKEPQFASCADISRIRSDLGWKPRHSLSEVIEEIVNEK